MYKTIRHTGMISEPLWGLGGPGWAWVGRGSRMPLDYPDLPSCPGRLHVVSQWVQASRQLWPLLQLCVPSLCLLTPNQELQAHLCSEPLCFPEHRHSCVPSLTKSSLSPRGLGRADTLLQWVPNSLESCSTMVACSLCPSSIPSLPVYSM